MDEGEINKQLILQMIQYYTVKVRFIVESNIVFRRKRRLTLYFIPEKITIIFTETDD